MKQSAGILLYRIVDRAPHFFLVHPGGPFWKNKDAGAWSIPKGEFTDNEQPLNAAIREFHEETGIRLTGDFIPLSSIKLRSGKTVFAWALEKDVDATKIISNNFEIEWPPRSGRMQQFPEIDAAGWFSMEEALVKINDAQGGLLRELAEILTNRIP